METAGRQETQQEREQRNLWDSLILGGLGFVLLFAGPVTRHYIYEVVPRKGLSDDLNLQIDLLAWSLSVPGLVYLFLGVFHGWMYKYVNKITFRGLGVTALQLIPGVLVSLLTPKIEGIPDWLPIALGSAVSLLVVRTTNRRPAE